MEKRTHRFLALLAVIAFFGGYTHLLMGQFSHHHLGHEHDTAAAAAHSPGETAETGCPHHHHPSPGEEEHGHGDDHEHHAPVPSDDPQKDCDDGCVCALTPATIDGATAIFLSIDCIETITTGAEIAPGGMIRSIDRPPTA